MNTYKDYSIKITPRETGKNTWSINDVEIYKEDKKIFTYTRTYPSCCEDTIFFFERDGIDYCLYSDDYVDISILNLSSMASRPLKLYEKYGAPSGARFCPVKIYVPKIGYSNVEIYGKEGPSKYFPIAIVQGCVWGNDFGNLQLRILDLRDMDNIKYISKKIKDNDEEYPVEFELSYSNRLDIMQDVQIESVSNDELRVYVPTVEFIDI